MAGASVKSLALRLRFQSNLEEEDKVSHDDVLFGYRMRLFTLAEEIGGQAGVSGDGRASLDVLSLEGPGRPLGP